MLAAERAAAVAAKAGELTSEVRFSVANQKHLLSF
jgi:hypothetical protein